MRDFEQKHFDGAGQYLVRMSTKEVHCNKEDNEDKFEGYINTSYLSTIMYKVGYITNNDNIGNGNQLICLTSMADGWTRYCHYAGKMPDGSTDFDSKVYWNRSGEGQKNIFVDYLNNNPQEYRFATQEEVVRVVLSQSHRWK